jgi:hypothetical protein
MSSFYICGVSTDQVRSYSGFNFIDMHVMTVISQDAPNYTLANN